MHARGHCVKRMIPLFYWSCPTVLVTKDIVIRFLADSPYHLGDCRIVLPCSLRCTVDVSTNMVCACLFWFRFRPVLFRI